MLSAEPESTTEQALDAARRVDPDALAEVLIQLTEEQRRELNPELLEITRSERRARQDEMLALERSRRIEYRNEKGPDGEFTAQLARWGTGNARDVDRGFLEWSFGPHPHLAELLAARPRRTIESIVLTSFGGPGSWFVWRDLIRRGVIDHPESSSYYLDLAISLDWCFYPERAELELLGPPLQGPPPERNSDSARAEALREQRRNAISVEVMVERLADDQPLPGEVITALSYEEVVDRISMSDTWLIALPRAVEAGLLDRDELVDAALTGQLRDLRKSSSAFFRKLFDALGPTVEECAGRASQLVQIVAAGQPSESAAAARRLRELVADGVELDASSVCAAVVTPLTGAQKAPAVEALRLVEAVDVGPVEKCRAAVHGLGHRHAEVQQRAVAVLESAVPDIAPDVLADAAGYVDSVAPANRPGLLKVLGEPEDVGVGPTSGATSDAAALFGPSEVDALMATLDRKALAHSNLVELLEMAAGGEMPGPLSFDPYAIRADSAAVEPFRSAAELLQKLTETLAGSIIPIELELVIDGLARTDPQLIGVDELSPVLALLDLADTNGRWHGSSVRAYLGVAVHHWCNRIQPESLPYLKVNRRRWFRSSAVTHDLLVPATDAGQRPGFTAFDGSSQPAGLLGFVSARLWEAVQIALTAPRPTLALPTSVNGWLEPGVLAVRLEEVLEGRATPRRFELIQALLRVRPGGSVPHMTRRVGDSPAGVALARLCGGQTDPGDEGLERAVSDRGHPLALAPVRFVNEEQAWEDTVIAYEVERRASSLRRDDPVGQLIAQLEPPAEYPRRWSPHGSSLLAEDRLLVDWTVVGMPGHHDVVAAVAAALMAIDLDSNRSGDTFDLLLSAAVEPDEPMSFGTHVMLAMGLCDRNTITSAAAGDLLIAAAVDGRLDACLLGRLLAQLMDVDVIGARRFAASTAGVVQVSPIVAERVRQMLGGWIAALQPDDPGRRSSGVHAVLETLEQACATSGRGVVEPEARARLEDMASGNSKRAQSARRLLELPTGDGSAAVAEAIGNLMCRAERWRAPPIVKADDA